MGELLGKSETCRASEWPSQDQVALLNSARRKLYYCLRLILYKLLINLLAHPYGSPTKLVTSARG